MNYDTSFEPNHVFRFCVEILQEINWTECACPKINYTEIIHVSVCSCLSECSADMSEMLTAHATADLPILKKSFLTMGRNCQQYILVVIHFYS
jgi:hypothetical protein